MKYDKISGFSDEISNEFIKQLTTVKELGMNYISIRGLDGRNIAEHSLEEVKEYILPTMAKYNISVSSIGSPIGKVFIDDEDGFKKQCEQLTKLVDMCGLMNCKYIRMFSFYIPKGKNPDDYKEEVINKLKVFVEIASKKDIILLHENEKDIFGDTEVRCRELLNEISSPNFKAIFDFANFVQVDVDTLKAYELLESDIEYIHIKDATKDGNVPCGTGDGEIKAILTKVFAKGYDGFLTLEPHLAVFDSLKDLELEDVSEIIKEDLCSSGEEAYEIQYKALTRVLAEI